VLVTKDIAIRLVKVNNEERNSTFSSVELNIMQHHVQIEEG